MTFHREALKLPDGRSRLLLHSCCAPCSGEVMEAIQASGIEYAISGRPLRDRGRRLRLRWRPERESGSFSQACPRRAPGKPARGVVSLGNGGFVTVAFDRNGIVDGPGVDFTVFENPLVRFGSSRRSR